MSRLWLMGNHTILEPRGPSGPPITHCHLERECKARLKCLFLKQPGRGSHICQAAAACLMTASFTDLSSLFMGKCHLLYRGGRLASDRGGKVRSCGLQVCASSVCLLKLMLLGQCTILPHTLTGALMFSRGTACPIFRFQSFVGCEEAI